MLFPSADVMAHPYVKHRDYSCSYGGLDEEGKPRTDMHVAGAMIDWWILSQATHAILSDKSSYGYSALARSLYNLSLPVTIGRSTQPGSCPRTVWEGHLCSGRPC